MEINKILGGKSRKSLLDSYSHEFSTSTMEDKLIILASLNYFGLLETFILDYKKDHQEIPHVLRNLKPTLIRFLAKMRFGSETMGKVFEGIEVQQLITELQLELAKNIAVNFTFNKLIASSLDENLQEFKYQNSFFKTNIQDDILPQIENRDLIEEKQQYEKFVHLYNFLHNTLIQNYRNNTFSPQMIDMGMAQEIQNVVKYYLVNPNKENYFRAIKYCVKILYFGQKPYR